MVHNLASLQKEMLSAIRLERFVIADDNVCGAIILAFEAQNERAATLFNIVSEGYEQGAVVQFVHDILSDQTHDQEDAGCQTCGCRSYAAMLIESCRCAIADNLGRRSSDRPSSKTQFPWENAAGAVGYDIMYRLNLQRCPGEFLLMRVYVAVAGVGLGDDGNELCALAVTSILEKWAAETKYLDSMPVTISVVGPEPQ